jgi:hypothetical protein
MKVDPRWQQNATARQIISEAVMRAVKAQELSYPELIAILGQEIVGWTNAEFKAKRDWMDEPEVKA